VVAPRGSPLRRIAGESGVAGVFGPGMDGDFAEVVAAHQGRTLAVLVDDAEQFADDPLDALVTAMLDAGEPGWAVVVATDGDELANRYRGLAVAVRRHRLGVLLQPDRHAPALLGAKPIGPVPVRAGLGLLVTGGRAVPIQVARS
jgi:hypothetical protein